MKSVQDYERKKTAAEALAGAIGGVFIPYLRSARRHQRAGYFRNENKTRGIKVPPQWYQEGMTEDQIRNRIDADLKKLKGKVVPDYPVESLEGAPDRRRGSGRPKTYMVEMNSKRIVEMLRQLPPTVGHRRVWLKLRGEGLSRNTVWRLMEEMGLLLPKQRGKCRRRYEALRAARCDEVWTVDTTYWPLNGSGV